ncbi:MAG: hypothetical protein HZA52_01260 [Planctomycetes bacterium]|nr:hypothetical protein [Planctomycetota bacterium]
MDDLARAPESALFAVPPLALAGNLPAAIETLSPVTPGLLPVERHLLSTLRDEFVELAVSAFKASLLRAPGCRTLHAHRSVPEREWRAAARYGADSAATLQDARVREEFVRWATGDTPWPIRDRRRLLATALRVANTARLRIYLCCDYQATGEWRASHRLAGDLLARGAAPVMRKHALDELGVAAMSLEREAEAVESYSESLALAERLGMTPFEIAIPALNLCVLAIRARRADTLERAVATLDSLDRAAADEATAAHIDILRRGREHGSHAAPDAIAWARRRGDRAGSSIWRIIDALA